MVRSVPFDYMADTDFIEHVCENEKNSEFILEEVIFSKRPRSFRSARSILPKPSCLQWELQASASPSSGQFPDRLTGY